MGFPRFSCVLLFVQLIGSPRDRAVRGYTSTTPGSTIIPPMSPPMQLEYDHGLQKQVYQHRTVVTPVIEA